MTCRNRAPHDPHFGCEGRTAPAPPSAIRLVNDTPSSRSRQTSETSAPTLVSLVAPHKDCPRAAYPHAAHRFINVNDMGCAAQCPGRADEPEPEPEPEPAPKRRLSDSIVVGYDDTLGGVIRVWVEIPRRLVLAERRVIEDVVRGIIATAQGRADA